MNHSRLAAPTAPIDRRASDEAACAGKLEVLLLMGSGVVAAAQTRFPRPRRGVIDGGDAVADRLPVAVNERDVDREVDARTRHHLPLERIAMQIDNARQHF